VSKIELKIWTGPAAASGAVSGTGASPAGDGGGWFAVSVEADDKTTLLDALESIEGRKDGGPGGPANAANGDGGLLYRHSCHHGSCGTCACIVNGVEKLACTTRLCDLEAGVVTVEPLRSALRLRDLAVFPDKLFDSMPEDRTYLRRIESGGGELGDGGLRFEDCIECGSCLSACPVRKDFIGPAALAAWSRELVNKPEREDEVLSRVGKKEGANACQRNIFCSLVCPTGVAPAKQIMILKGALQRRGRSTISADPK
jgi:succinate dehydrogenase / fumarate reductase iron-sulfur subunit